MSIARYGKAVLLDEIRLYIVIGAISSASRGYLGSDFLFSTIPFSPPRRLLVHLAEQRRGGRRDHELDQRLRGVALLGDGQQADAVRTRQVEASGHGPDEIGPRRAHHDVGLLDAELEVAARQVEGDGAGAAAGEDDLGLQLLGEAELGDSLGGIVAAAAARIADRLRRHERLRVRLDGADVGLERAGADRDAERGKHIGRRAAGHDPAFLDVRLERLGAARDQVRGPAGDPLLQRLAGFLEHRHLVPARAREGGGELVQPGRVALARQDDDLGRVRHGAPRYACDRECENSREAMHCA